MDTKMCRKSPVASTWCAFLGSLYLYTTELGTTPPPELSTSRLLYIRFRQNRLKYYMIKRTKVHHWLCRKMVLHGKQEYCTSQNKGILYITEIRNIVHHRKQEYCTSLKSGILYITEKKEFCTTQKRGILYNTEIRKIVHHSYDEECKWALCCCSIVWGNTYIGCILEVKCHQCSNAYLTFAYIIACIKKNWCEAWCEVNWPEGAHTLGAF